MRGGGAASLKPLEFHRLDGVGRCCSLFGHDCGYLLEFATGAVHSTSAAVSLCRASRLWALRWLDMELRDLAYWRPFSVSAGRLAG